MIEELWWGGGGAAWLDGTDAQPWLCSVLASAVIGLAGIVPLAVIPSNYRSSEEGETSRGGDTLSLLLSFAVGGLLADVFLHLLPEAWEAALQGGLDPHTAFTRVGLSVLVGVFLFIVVEILANASSEQLDDTTAAAAPQRQDQARSCGPRGGAAADVYEKTPSFSVALASRFVNGIDGEKCVTPNGADYDAADCSVHTSVNNNNIDSRYNKNIITTEHNDFSEEEKEADSLSSPSTPARKIEIVGYLNLVANGIDNFAHGLAVAGSFLVSRRSGVLTTAAILVHEVPHEIGDFAILLNAGFSRWEAAKAQLYTAGIGLLGALCTLCVGSSDIIDCAQMYILGVTSGAFLNIALVSVLPPLLKERRPGHSVLQGAVLLLGAVLMASVAC